LPTTGLGPDEYPVPRRYPVSSPLAPEPKMRKILVADPPGLDALLSLKEGSKFI